jgi:hypothetical protein
MIEVSLIKLLLNRDNYIQYGHYITAKEFPTEYSIVLDCLQKHYTNSEESLSEQDLANLVFSLNPKDKEFYSLFFQTLSNYTPVETTAVALIESIKQRRILQALSLTAYEVAEGKKEFNAVDELINQLRNPDETSSGDFDFVSNDLEDLFSGYVDTPGLSWRLPFLNKSLGPLRQGDFGFLFARPETGKTTFLASETTHMLAQVAQNNWGPIILFNNEEQGKKVNLRVIQSYFGVSRAQLAGNLQHYRKLFAETAGPYFKQYDNAQIDRKVVEAICKKYNPSLIVFDQLDKITGFRAEREDLLLGAKYTWARELAKQYGPVLGICQADGSGEGVRWLTMAHVANAKTAKQSEADWILGIGCIPDSGYEYVRFLNISKNKLLGGGSSEEQYRHGKGQVFIDPVIARYYES